MSPPDGVVHDVGTFAAGELLHRVDEVLLLVVDREVDAELLQDLDLLRSARGRDHHRARGAAQLDRRAADTARARVHEQRLARLQRGAPMQREVTGLVHDVQRRRGRERHRIGNREHAARRVRGRVFRESSGRLGIASTR